MTARFTIAIALLLLGVAFLARAPQTLPTKVSVSLQESGPEWVLAAYDYQLVPIAPSTFVMGSDERESIRRDDEEPHRVRLTRPYLLGATEVTQELWEAVTHTNPSRDGRYPVRGEPDAPCSKWGVGPDLPITCVSWFEALDFLNTLSLLEGLEPAYEWSDGEPLLKENPSGYRLPSEAEWERAAKGGLGQRFAGTDRADEVCLYANVLTRATLERHHAWIQWPALPCEDDAVELSPPQSGRPNALGLYDLSGNVQEWTWDAYAPSRSAEQTDPIGPQGRRGADRVVKGGGWMDSALNLRNSARVGRAPDTRHPQLGLRVARTVPSD